MPGRKVKTSEVRPLLPFLFACRFRLFPYKPLESVRTKVSEPPRIVFIFWNAFYLCKFLCRGRTLLTLTGFNCLQRRHNPCLKGNNELRRWLDEWRAKLRECGLLQPPPDTPIAHMTHPRVVTAAAPRHLSVGQTNASGLHSLDGVAIPRQQRTNAVGKRGRRVGVLSFNGHVLPSS